MIKYPKIFTRSITERDLTDSERRNVDFIVQTISNLEPEAKERVFRHLVRGGVYWLRYGTVDSLTKAFTDTMNTVNKQHDPVYQETAQKALQEPRDSIVTVSAEEAIKAIMNTGPKAKKRQQRD